MLGQGARLCLDALPPKWSIDFREVNKSLRVSRRTSFLRIKTKKTSTSFPHA